ncbi:Tyrosyl-tRNA synthetase [hydrothermal vent metagenome]|uniref:tyrosine--tRNA ligase n=1 Tax=hydrothermal vent metagenome TaxID=652676 RepID=A0A3B0QU46_9ZZZZ
MDFKDPKEQLGLIKAGAVDLISESELLAKLTASKKSGKPLRVKAGFDPTAPDLHLGHTVLIQKLKNFQDLGHHVLLLVGDFTARIGDPTGKNETRKPVTTEEIARNSETYKEQAFRILDRDRTEVVFNSEWMDKMTAAEVVSLAAKHTVARMLERDDFSKRYKRGQPIAIHEFLYPLVQGYDSVVLSADVELGGTDQLFNLLVGRQLQKESGQAAQVVLTTALLEGTDGIQKMSKSLGNYIGITEPASEIFGKVMSISDEMMVRYYSLLTDTAPDKIEDIKAGRVHPRDAKADLAAMLVERFCGAAEAEKAREGFGKKPAQDVIEEVVVYCEQPTIPLPNVMVQSGLTDTTSSARRDIKGGGVRVDETKVEDVRFVMSVGGEHLIQRGKRHFKKVKIESK